MWLQPLSHCFLVAALVSQTGPSFSPADRSASAPSQTTTSELVATRHPVFAIPFRVEKSNDPSWQPVEAQLLVSTDQGAHWRQYAKAPTTEQRFKFRSNGDGEYWFAIRTVDRAGQVRPKSIHAPGLRVLVDTKAPILKIKAEPIQGGQVMVYWEINEQNIRPEGLKIVYRPSPTQPWTAVPLESRALDAATAKQNGKLIFRPQSGTDEIPIRAEVFDTAGNAAVVQTRINTKRAAMPAVATGPDGSVAVAIHPRIGNRYPGPTHTSVQRPTMPGLPPGERPRMVNSRNFELAYDLDSVGPSGIGRVELWGTHDSGQTWRRFVANDGQRNPLVVQVNDEGLYGFRAVVTSGAGLGGKPPQDGDSPDIWIGVDTKKPTARIVSAAPGVNSEADRLIISWQADDQLLAARPVSILFSADRQGPWTPLASGLQNTGRYAWPVDGRAPPRIFLRLEVRDEAGNVGVHELPDPVIIDQSRPTARIRDVRPVAQP